MDDIRSSFSRFKKDIKYHFRGKKPAPDKAAVNIAEEGADPSASLPRSDSRPLASGHDEEGNKTSTDMLRDLSRDRSPRPESIPAGEGNDDPQRRETSVDGREAEKRHSGLESNAGVAVGGGPDQGIHPSPSSPSLPHKAEPDGG